jgi:hypothetical protein
MQRVLTPSVADAPSRRRQIQQFSQNLKVRCRRRCHRSAPLQIDRLTNCIPVGVHMLLASNHDQARYIHISFRAVETHNIVANPTSSRKKVSRLMPYKTGNKVDSRSTPNGSFSGFLDSLRRRRRTHIFPYLTMAVESVVSEKSLAVILCLMPW